MLIFNSCVLQIRSKITAPVLQILFLDNKKEQPKLYNCPDPQKLDLEI